MERIFLLIAAAAIITPPVLSLEQAGAQGPLTFKTAPVTNKPQATMIHQVPVLVQPSRYSTIDYNRPYVQNAYSLINTGYYPRYEQLRAIPIQSAVARPPTDLSTSAKNLRTLTRPEPRFILFPWTWEDMDHEDEPLPLAEEPEVHTHKHIIIDGQYAILDDGFVYYYDHTWSRNEKEKKEPTLKSIEFTASVPSSTIAPLIIKNQAAAAKPN